MRLEGKVALVTGAGQGIGRAVVTAFLSEGARVVATDIDIGKFQDLPPHPALETACLDVTDDAAIEATALRNGQVSVLVNCAGYVASGSILTASTRDLDRCYQINVRSMFSMVQGFLPSMLEREHGAIINIASVVSTVRTAADRCAYATSKGAVIALTQSIAYDLIRRGVRCNCISPGTVQTPSLQERASAAPDPAAALERLVGRQPLGRLGQAKEIAAVAVLLASDETGFRTGSNVVIDGGFSL